MSLNSYQWYVVVFSKLLLAIIKFVQGIVEQNILHIISSFLSVGLLSLKNFAFLWASDSHIDPDMM